MAMSTNDKQAVTLQDQRSAIADSLASISRRRNSDLRRKSRETTPGSPLSARGNLPASPASTTTLAQISTSGPAPGRSQSAPVSALTLLEEGFKPSANSPDNLPNTSIVPPMPALRLNDQDMPASFEDPAAMLRELEQNKHPRIGQSSLQDFKKLHQESMTASLEDPVATLRELESSKYPNVGQSNLQGPKKPHQESTAASFEDPAVVLGELESGKHRARGQGSFDDFERLRLEMEAAFHIGGKAAEKSTLTKAMPTKGLPTKVTHSKAEALAEAPDTLVEYIAARSEQIEDEQATAWEEYAKLENGSTVIVTNIAAGADEEDVMDLFGYFSIRHMKLLSKRDPQTRTQVAHVNMNSRASAKMAVRRLEHEIRVTGGGRIFGLPINVQLMVKD